MTTAPLYYYGFDDHLVEVLVHEGIGRLEALPEAFVQDLWAQQAFEPRGLQTTRGEPIEVLGAGRHNSDSGPDFLGAHLRVGGVEWRGDVEIHVTSHGWVDHAHASDARYNAVVLHVALQADLTTGTLARHDGSILPEIILAPRLTAPLRRLLYQFLTQPEAPIPCAAGWPHVPEALKSQAIAQSARARLVERGEAFVRDVRALAERQGGGEARAWNRVFVSRLFAALGASPNAEPMRMLAERLPLRHLRALRDPAGREALLLGLAGLLPRPADLVEADRATADYAIDLAERFQAQQAREEREPLLRSHWHTGRMRPANAPALRLAQAADWFRPGALLGASPLERAAEAFALGAPREVADALCAAVEASAGPFWETHRRLDRSGRPMTTSIGARRRQQLVLNAVLPSLAAARTLGLAPPGSFADDKLLGVMAALRPEADRVVKRFRALGVRPRSARETQGLHQLFRTRCADARCLSCPIGAHLIRTPAHGAEGRGDGFGDGQIGEPEGIHLGLTTEW